MIPEENKVKEVMRRVAAIPPYRDRAFKLKKKQSVIGEDLYAWIINVWIPAQPDKDNLMHLFILLHFNALAFVELVITGDLKLTLETYNE